jgi:hypothetical protein
MPTPSRGSQVSPPEGARQLAGRELQEHKHRFEGRLPSAGASGKRLVPIKPSHRRKEATALSAEGKLIQPNKRLHVLRATASYGDRGRGAPSRQPTSKDESNQNHHREHAATVRCESVMGVPPPESQARPSILSPSGSAHEEDRARSPAQLARGSLIYAIVAPGELKS